MGSLERVQFKFASIIGELCSEPILLSQFAVWLDMKLAEYKAKGSISLDCSGEKPEPPWMKGVLPPSPASLPTALFEENPTQDTNTDMSPFLKSSQNSQKSNFIRNQNQTSALSDRDLYNSETGVKPEDDFIVIKEEQGEQIDCIYESNSRLNDTVPQQSIDNYSEAAFRKRLSSSDSQYTSHTITSPSKIRRMSPASAALSSPSSAASNLNAGSSRDIHLDPSSSDRSMFPPSDQSQNSWLGQVTADREVESPVRLPTGSTREHTTGTVEIHNKWNHSRSRHPVAHHFDRGVAPRLNSTKRNMNAVVRSFERWLWTNSTDDRRPVLQIPPDELDGYLADYFTTMKKPSGLDYNPLSFQVYRTSLEKYLKENNYGTSIFSSVFHRSQLAFRKRKAQLEEAAKLSISASIQKDSERS